MSDQNRFPTPQPIMDPAATFKFAEDGSALGDIDTALKSVQALLAKGTVERDNLTFTISVLKRIVEKHEADPKFSVSMEELRSVIAKQEKELQHLDIVQESRLSMLQGIADDLQTLKKKLI